jgi:hypothetical protein
MLLSLPRSAINNIRWVAVNIIFDYQPTHMRKLLALLSVFCLSFTFALQAQVYELDRPYHNHLEMQKLKGKVKQVKEYRYKHTGPKKESIGTKGALEMYFVTTYNRNGNKVEYRLFRADHSIARLEEYEYDVKGRLISVKGGDPNSKGSGSVASYVYDSKGRLMSESNKMRTSGNVIFEKTYRYDNKNRLIHTEGFFPIGKDRYTTMINYTGDIELVEASHKRPNVTSKTTRYYDVRSKLLLRENHTYSKSPGAHDTYSYDNFGNKIMIKHFKGDEKTFDQELFMYDYDKNHNWVNRHSIFHKESSSQSETIATRELSYY